MKRKSGRSKNSIGKSSSNHNKNIDLRISKIPNSLLLNNLSPTLARSRASPKGRAKSKINNSKKGVAYSVNKTRQMNWKQLKHKFPNMNPNSDADFDGLVNSRDCKPLDPSKDGAFSRFIGIITGGRKGQSAEEYKAERATKSSVREKIRAIEKATRPPKIVRTTGKAVSGFLSGTTKTIVTGKGKDKKVTVIRVQSPTAQAIQRAGKAVVKVVETATGVSGSQTTTSKRAKGQKQAGAGRPKGSYDYKDPRTGEPIPAVEYHKIRKQLKKQAKTVETKAEIQQRFALAKRGLSPEEVTAAQEEINARMARLRAIKEAKQAEAQTEDIQQLPQEEIEQQTIQQQAQQVPQQVVEQQIPQQQIRTQPQRIQRVEPMTAVPGSYGIPPGYKLQEDLMTGRKTLVQLPQREAWVRR